MKWRDVEELDLSTIRPKSTAAIVRGDGATGRHFLSPTNMQECSGKTKFSQSQKIKIKKCVCCKSYDICFLGSSKSFNTRSPAINAKLTFIEQYKGGRQLVKTTAVSSTFAMAMFQIYRVLLYQFVRLKVEDLCDPCYLRGVLIL
jgi:hypothetical protein